MTVPSAPRSAGPFVGNGVTTAFPFTFKVFSATDVAVYYTDANGVQTLLSSNYTVVPNADQDTTPGGTVNYPTVGVTLSAAESLALVGDLAYVQGTDITNAGRFLPQVVENVFDFLTILAQQLVEKAGRMLSYPVGDTASGALPSATGRASKFLAFDASGNPIASTGTGADAGMRTDLSATGGSALVGWLSALAGAVTATLKDWIGWRAPSPLDFMSIAMRADVINGTLALDHTAAVQAAINTGKTVDLLGYKYKVNNLTVTTAGQSIVSSVGIAQLIKNANGPLVTVSVASVECRNISFRGDAAAPVFTGDNVVATGDDFHLINCGSRWAAGRAVKATGAHTLIEGTCDLYQTADASAAGYDIEIGVSGTATLYHQLIGVRTSQSTGGILLTDTGSADIIGGQFGKLTIAAGTGPAGVNGGNTIGPRILGNVSIGVSNASLTACTFAGATITIQAGVTGTCIDPSNILSNTTTIVNSSGNFNQMLLQNAYSGAAPVKSRLKFGDSASLAVLNWDPASGDMGADGNWYIPIGKSLVFRDAAGATLGSCTFSSGNGTMSLGVGTTFGITSAGSGGHYVNVGGTAIAQTYSGGIRPNLDNAYNCGTASQRWALLFAGSATVQTSDARLKQQVRSLSDAEKAVAVRAKGLLRAFKFNDAVEAKGDGARIHFGVMAQDLSAAFAAEGLDASKYGMLCFDTWDAQPEVVGEDGSVITPAREAGDRYGVRYEELLAFIIAAI